MDTKDLENNSETNDNAETTKKLSGLSRFKCHSYAVQNCILVWLDFNVSIALDDEHRNIIHQVRQIIHDINIFSDVNKCIDYLYEIKHEKIFMIVSGSLGQYIVPHIHDMSKLDSIYIFCGAPSRHEKWTQEWSKVKGVFTQIEPICDSLKEMTKKCKQDCVSLSIVKPTNVCAQNFDQLDQSFMYTQILKEILLEIEYDEQSFQDLVAYCRLQYANNLNELNFIKIFESNYRQYSPIYWYTHPGFIYVMLNRALRTFEIDTIIKMGFFIQDLCKEISKIQSEQVDKQEKQSFVVYRGQGLSKDDFDKLSKAKGGLVSFNNFLSTSKKRDISLEFSTNALSNPDVVGVVFKMVIDPSELATPYIFIDKDSYFQNNEEEEVLFSMHTVFRIGEIKSIQKNNRLYQIILTLTNSKNKQVSALTELLREETQGSTGWHRLGMLMIKLAEFDRAEQVYRTLFDMNPDDNEKALLHHQLGLIKRNQGEYEEALLSYQKALDIYERTRPSDDLDLATTYNNMGQVYHNMGEYATALSYYEKSFEVYEHKLPENHPSLAASYNNIGSIYRILGDLARALEYHEKALEIEQKALPTNHPSLAISYKNIGLVHKNMGDYSKALVAHEKALEIEQQSLPSNHPSLAISYNNTGLLYDLMGEYSKALSFYERTLQIYEKILPPTHPDLALSFNNIGSVYKNMGEYAKALSFYKRTLDIEKESLLENHPSLAISYNNIGLIYDQMGEYSQALSSYEKALEICKKTLSAVHPMLAILHNNIGSVRDNMGDRKAALECYKKSLAIEQKSLPPTHPDLASSYNNIGLVYDNLGDYTEALSYHEKALAIYEVNLPSNHPDLANSYSNIGITFQKTQEYTKALLYYEKALEIREESSCPNYLDLIACYGNISGLYQVMGDHPKALFYYEQLVHTREKFSTIDQSSLTMSFNNIDQIYQNNRAASKIVPSTKPHVEIKQDLPYDRTHFLTKFRMRLEKIRRRCNK